MKCEKCKEKTRSAVCSTCFKISSTHVVISRIRFKELNAAFEELNSIKDMLCEHLKKEITRKEAEIEKESRPPEWYENEP